MADNKQGPAKITDDQGLTILVPKEKERYAIRKADWDRMKKNIKKAQETYGDFTFLQKSYWVLGTFSLTLVPTTLSLWLTSAVTWLVIAYLTLLLCSLVFAIILYFVDAKVVREQKESKLREILEDMAELEKSLEKQPEETLSIDIIGDLLRGDQEMKGPIEMQ